MRVRHVVPFALLVAALLPGASSGAACAPLDCGPAGLTVAGGRALAVTSQRTTNVVDLSSGKVRLLLVNAVFSADGRRAVAQAGSLLQTYDLATRKVTARASAGGGWALGGVSADGRRVVLFQRGDGTTRVAIRSGSRQQTFAFRGSFDFDGLLGTRLYLIERAAQGGYYVRVADLATGKLVPEPLKDADEPALINGQAWSRVPSRDGRYLFTTYVTGNGAAMIHELDMRAGEAWCIDLPGTGDYNAAASYATALSRDGTRLYAVAAAYGRLVTIDVATHRVVDTASFAQAQPPEASLPSASLSPDGKTLAFSNVNALWLYDLTAGRVMRKATLPTAPVVVAYGPSGRIWYVNRAGTSGRVAL
jgi:hypothetical protein